MCLYAYKPVLNFIPVFEGSSSTHDLHDVRNTLYGETSLSNTHYSPTTSSETPAGNVYEMAASAAAGEGYPYETPLPLHMNDGGNDI